MSAHDFASRRESESEEPVPSVATKLPAEACVLRGISLGSMPQALPRRRATAGSAFADVAARQVREATGAAPYSVAAADADLLSTAHRAELDQAYERGLVAGREAGLTAVADEARALGAQQGYQEGLERGLQEGRERALDIAKRAEQAAQLETAARLAALDALVQALPEQIQTRLEACEDDMIALCHAAICRVLGDAVVHGDGAARIVRAAVAACTGEAAHAASDLAITAIHVHPRDLARLSADPSLAAWLAPRLGAGKRGALVPWMADESVGPGGCIVRSSEGNLDARLEAQLAALTEWLARAYGAAAPTNTEEEAR